MPLPLHGIILFQVEEFASPANAELHKFLPAHFSQCVRVPLNSSSRSLKGPFQTLMKLANNIPVVIEALTARDRCKYQSFINNA